MSVHSIAFSEPTPATAFEALVISDKTSPFRDRPIGEILVSTGVLTAANLDRALSLQQERKIRIGNILVAEGLVEENALEVGLALQQGIRQLRITPERVSGELIDRLGADICLRHGVLPWRQAGRWVIVACARPQDFVAMRPMLEARLGPVRIALGDAGAMRAAILEHRSGWLTSRAETRAPHMMSVRSWSARRIGLSIVALATIAAVSLITAPVTAGAALTVWAILCLAAMTALRLSAALAVLFAPRRPARIASADADSLPRMSLLVPLLSEAEITAHLVDRLSEIDYPEARVEFVLVTEAGDSATRAALDDRGLPANFRWVTVPAGTIRTKPRAMNYALDFCSGDIIGIYDAEDAPEPDQLLKVAAAYASAPPDVVCLQGRLAFYNPNQNWLARCFALDYAAWFRIVLPGLARLGFAIPLGGTTLFFRRNALEAMGRWDAHNVTEDADLGIRLARFGFRADIVDTTTREEANCRVGPWIRQRARWLKGYALTWAIHMRQPGQLLRDLGLKRFLGVQIVFLGTVSLFLLAPLLWTFWMVPLGLDHPLGSLMPRWALLSLGGFFVLSELVNIVVSAVAVGRKGDRWLIPWIPAMTFYFPLAAIASYRALIDCAARPFFWDKTTHGLSLPRRRIQAVRAMVRERTGRRAA